MKSLSDLNKTISKWAETETVKMQNRLFTGIKADTPIDTGKAKAGWTNENIKRLGDTGRINNDVDYIGWLEFGTDKMQPFGMVRKNIKQVVGK